MLSRVGMLRHPLRRNVALHARWMTMPSCLGLARRAKPGTFGEGGSFNGDHGLTRGAPFPIAIQHCLGNASAARPQRCLPCPVSMGLFRCTSNNRFFAFGPSFMFRYQATLPDRMRIRCCGKQPIDSIAIRFRATASQADCDRRLAHPDPK